MSSKMITVWVQSIDGGEQEWTVDMSEDAIVDGLKKAIMQSKFGSDVGFQRLTIKASPEEIDLQPRHPLTDKAMYLYSIAPPAPGHAGKDTLMGKRKYDAILQSTMGDVAPSSFGLIRDKHSWVTLHDEINLKMHRPSPNFTGIHVSLMSEVLGKFCEDVKNIKLEREDNTFAVKFCNAMCGVFTAEDGRMALGNSMLSSYLGVAIDRQSGRTGGWRNDGGVRVMCGDNILNTIGAIHLEYNNELCSTSSSPGEQALASYLKLMIETPFAMRRSVCPALLCVIAGPYMGVSAVVEARGPCVDPVVPLLPLLVLKQDIAMMTAVARTLKAVKVCVASLTAHYKNLESAEPSEEKLNQLMYPYPRHFRCGDVVVPFVYVQQIEDKLVFKVRVTEQVADFVLDQEIIVKFTKTYCVEAHQLCYSFHESAPRLYACQQLANGWLMLAMEMVHGEDFRHSLPGHVNERLWQVVRVIHNGGLVHGDLRGNNIRTAGDRVCLLDFDWSGRAGEQRYPAFMNHQDIDWPEGASDGEVLLPEHDVEWLRRLGVVSI